MIIDIREQVCKWRFFCLLCILNCLQYLQERIVLQENLKRACPTKRGIKYEHVLIDHLLSDSASKLRFICVTPPAVPFYPFSISIYRVSCHFPVFDFLQWPILGGVIRCGVVSYSVCKGLKVTISNKINHNRLLKLPRIRRPRAIY
jgi:hypothetical protein